ncbi:MAG: penicillin V acylase-like amidase (Ntn superfamily) [Francisellaceae bacterium]|jgi:penicillin V acylase-like amidase (Ntn superfamily)
MIKRNIMLLCCSFLLLNNILFACSVFSIDTVNKKGDVTNVLGARTIDFELGLSTAVSKGVVGDKNVSHVNLDNISKKNTVSWNTKYNFIGQPLTLSGQVSDGINSQGLYMGALYLPGQTDYPRYNKLNEKKALAVLDLINYVLGTSTNVNEAIQNLQKIQIVESSVYIFGKYHVFPLHYYLKDKSGDGAIIEFIAGETKIYHGANINVLTNSPAYEWQARNEKNMSQQFSNHNTKFKVDGVYANGSGYIGLPGDYMPQSRFVKMKSMLKAFPVSYNDIESSYGLNMTLNSIIVPIGMNPAPTLRYSKFDLKNGEYDITNLVILAENGYFTLSGNNTKPLDSLKTDKYNVNDLLGIKLKAIVSYPSEIDKDKSQVVHAAGARANTSYKVHYANFVTNE